MSSEASQIKAAAAKVRAMIAAPGETAAPVQRVNRNAVNAITRSICDGLKQVSGTGSLLTQVCKLARTFYRGKSIPSADVSAILDELADRNGWKGPSAAIRRSEYKSVLGAYATLDEYMSAFLKRAGYCSWHDGISLARQINQKAPLNRAIAALLKRGKKASAAPANRSEAKKAVAKAMKRVLNLKHLERGFLESLRSLCSEYGVRV